MSERLFHGHKAFYISHKQKNGLKYLLIALPFVIFVTAIYYVPLFGWAYAFFDYRIGHALGDMSFVGLYNFTKIFDQYQEIVRVLRNTIVMSLLNILVTPLPAIFAVMLNEITNRKVKKFVQTTTTLPNFISWIVVYTWMDNFLLIQSTKLQTVQLILYNYLNSAEALANSMKNAVGSGQVIQSSITPQSVQMTTIVVSVIPILLVYPFMQKYFTKGIMMGAVKG